jgi:predicted Zn-dependent protease
MLPSRLHLTLERLEDRLTPALYGVTWPDPGHLTLSFVPDGTDVGGAPSVLFQKLNAQALPFTWQGAVFNALRAWADQGHNVNVATVLDGGQPLGIVGAPEGDARFGDIRVAMRPLVNTSVAEAQPFSWTGTTWSSDIVLNSNFHFGASGTPGFDAQSMYDVFSVVLHEAGHVFGLDDNTTDRSSVMYETYQGVRTGLGQADVSNFQALYGSPTLLGINLGSIPLLGNLLNTTLNSATNLVQALTQSGDLRFQATAQGTLTSPTDAHYYKITSPSYGNVSKEAMVAMVWSEDGQTRPRVDVLDANGNPVAGAQLLANDGGTFTVQIPNAPVGGAVYYLKVSNLTAGSFKKSGNFFLGVNFHNTAPITLDSYSAATLTQSSPMTSNTLTLGQNWLFHFTLSADTGGSALTAEVQMYIYDANGKQVFALIAYAGQPPSSAVTYLQAGTYTVRFVAVPKTPGQLPPLTYQLLGEILDDPIGPQPVGSSSDSGSSSGSGSSWSGPSTTANGPSPSGGGYSYS